MEKKSIRATTSLVFRALTLAMGVAVVVLSCMGSLEVQTAVTLLGGILLGIIESMAKSYISTQLANSIVFAVLIIMLLVRPAGLLGKYVPEHGNPES